MHILFSIILIIAIAYGLIGLIGRRATAVLFSLAAAIGLLVIGGALIYASTH